MDKNWYKSKTVWGFGLLGLTLIGQAIGTIPNSTATDIFEILFGFLGVYGVRDAL